jgi:hypothetical protein
MVGVRALTITSQVQARVGQKTFSGNDRIPAGLADIDAISAPIEGPALICGDKLQGVEAIQDTVAKAIDASDQDCVDETVMNPARSGSEHLGA